MTRQENPDTLSGFEYLSDCISLYKPSSLDATFKRHAEAYEPKMVVLCTWVGTATLRRIEKYTKRYQQLLPQAQILLIQASIFDMTVRSFTQQRRRLQPARDAIAALTSAVMTQDNSAESSNAEDCIVLHMFSHSGSNTAIQLALSMQESNLALPLQAVIFDGTPGTQTFQVSYNAWALSLPTHPIGRFLSSVAIVPIIGTLTLLSNVGVLPSIEDLRKILNHPRLFGSTAPRLYLYSKEDVMIDWMQVELHMQDAREKGYRVTGVKFEVGSHCALVIKGAEQYWAAVKDLWENSNTHLPADSGIRGASKL